MLTHGAYHPMRTVAKQTTRAKGNIMKYDIHDWEKEYNLKKRLYRLAKRKGLALKLCRKSEGLDSRTFRILDRRSGRVLHSARPGGYGLTLDQVEEYLSHHSSRKQVGTKQTEVNEKTVEAVREILNSWKPKGKDTGSQNATPAETPLSTTPSKSHTPALTDRNAPMLYSNNPVCSGLLVPPLIKVEVEVKLELVKAGGDETQPSAKNGLDWFLFEDIPQFPSPSALLVCRDLVSLRVSQGEDKDSLIGVLELLFSIHPFNPNIINEAILRAEVEKAIQMGLAERFKFKRTAQITVAVKYDAFGPGVIGNPDAYVGSRLPVGPRIVLAKSCDWAVKTCHLTGEHFYPPAPLAFYYDGDATKPVSPVVALKLGFTISSELLRALSALLNTAENLTALPGEIASVEYRDNQYAGPSELEAIVDQWGGAINKWFRTHPQIEPQNIPAALARATGDTMDLAREFLRDPAQHPTQPGG